VTEPSRAVFLSYASQDAESAHHLCNALRTAGIEVWFDQSELRGGDVWDASIRRQIKSCALFIPVISKNTHTRGEGYFRLEWKLAVDRSHLMASDLPFLLPVVIDDTPDAEDRVPDRFREVQWTRLPGGSNADAFVEHVRRLLALVATTPVARRAQSSALPTSSTGAAPTRSVSSFSHSFLPWILGFLLILGTGYYVADKFLASKSAMPGAPAPANAPAPSEAVKEKSVAVLPFVDMSEKKDQEYFSDGLSEELIDMLTKVTDLRVPARTSSFYFKGKPTTIAEIAKVLRVAHVVEGSVRKSGKHLRITAQLVRTDDGYHVWSETYDRQADDIFKVQDEIAAAVVKALKVSLMGQPLVTVKGSQNIEAYNLYLQARSIYFHEDSSVEVEKAADYLRKALRADATFAPAWAFLARVLSYQADSMSLPPDGPVIEEGLRAVQRALELDPNLAEAHAAASRIYMVNLLDPVRAEPELRQALANEPNNSYALSLAANLYAVRGQFEKAMDLNQRSINGDPANPVKYYDRAQYLIYAKKYTDALSNYRELLDLDPGYQWIHSYIGEVILAQGDAAKALEEMNRESDEKRRLCNVGRALAYDGLGRKAEADAVLAFAEKNCADINAYGIGVLHASRGEVDQAFKWFDLAFRHRDVDLLSAKVDPMLKNVQSDPRFSALLKKMGLAD
jgi:TolB-like protein/Tfp pilus assembly protein PilF